MDDNTYGELLLHRYTKRTDTVPFNGEVYLFHGDGTCWCRNKLVVPKSLFAFFVAACHVSITGESGDDHRLFALSVPVASGIFLLNENIDIRVANILQQCKICDPLDNIPILSYLCSPEPLVDHMFSSDPATRRYLRQAGLGGTPVPGVALPVDMFQMTLANFGDVSWPTIDGFYTQVIRSLAGILSEKEVMAACSARVSFLRDQRFHVFRRAKTYDNYIRDTEESSGYTERFVLPDPQQLKTCKRLFYKDYCDLIGVTKDVYFFSILSCIYKWTWVAEVFSYARHSYIDDNYKSVLSLTLGEGYQKSFFIWTNGPVIQPCSADLTLDRPNTLQTIHSKVQQERKRKEKFFVITLTNMSTRRIQYYFMDVREDFEERFKHELNSRGLTIKEVFVYDSDVFLPSIRKMFRNKTTVWSRARVTMEAVKLFPIIGGTYGTVPISAPFGVFLDSFLAMHNRAAGGIPGESYYGD